MRRVLAVAAALALAACPKRPEPAPSGITLSVPYDVDTLDPHARDRLGNFAVAVHFYEPLVGTDREMRIYPKLAVRWDNPDLLTWVFHLQENVTFHDGSPFSADDVVYSFERLTREKDLDIGLYVVQIASVRAVNRHTVEIKTRRPMGVLLNKISSVLIVPKGATAPWLTEHENGTGPYRLTEWKKGRELTMTRNESYRGKKPALSSARFLLSRTPEDARKELLAGTSQFAQVRTRAAEQMLKERPDVALLHRTGIFLKYVGFDLARETTPFVESGGNPFRKRAVREAVSLAIDRKALVAGLPSSAVPASQVVPPFIFGFNPHLPALSHDLERAKRLLRDAGYPDGFDVTLHVRSVVGESAGAVRDMLAPLGIRVTLVELAEPEFFDLATHLRPSFFLTRYGCSTGDASDVLDAAFHSIDEPLHYGTSNIASHSSLELDKEIEESAEILEMESRRDRLHRIMATLMADVLWVPLYYDEDVYAVKRPYEWKPRADSYVLVWEIGVKPG